MTVALVVPEKYGFPDNWIYIHDPEVEVGRIQNFGSWSPYLVKDGRTCLGLEFFVQRGRRDVDRSPTRTSSSRPSASSNTSGWSTRRRSRRLRGADAEGVPVLRREYKSNVDVLRGWIAENTPNVYPVGRNGMHRYNNQDHSMYTAMLSVENIFGADHDVWSVNVEEEYHEEVSPGAQGIQRA